MKYDYSIEVKNDVINFLIYEKDYIIEKLEGKNIKVAEDILYTLCRNTDCITGDPSGSYTCNSHTAATYLADNWDLMVDVIDLYEAMDNLGSPETIDVLVRLYVLTKVIDDLLFDVDTTEELIEMIKRGQFE